MAKRSVIPEPTIDEWVATLKRTSLPTVVIEGKDDVVVFRRLEERQSMGLSILPVGGREKVIKLFDRRDEFATNKKLVFVADRDNWVITGIPEAYQVPEFLFTSGYAIENDVFVDGNLESLLHHGERDEFKRELLVFIEWYALALSRHLSGRSYEIKLHPNHVLDNEDERRRLMSLVEGEDYPNELKNQLMSQYGKLLRGKSLLALLLRYLGKEGRGARHNDKALIEMVAANPGALIKKLFDDISQFFCEERASDPAVSA